MMKHTQIFIMAVLDTAIFIQGEDDRIKSGHDEKELWILSFC
jgi:hypothetical protein